MFAEELIPIPGSIFMRTVFDIEPQTVREAIVICTLVFEVLCDSEDIPIDFLV